MFTNLQDANLMEANLQNAGLTAANLQDAGLTAANLQNAILIKANLQDANLTEANLQGAILSGANLQDANLTEANLQCANLRGDHLDMGEYDGMRVMGGLIQKDEKNSNSTQLHDSVYVFPKTIGQLSDICQDVYNVEVEQLLKVKTLYRAELSAWMGKKIKKIKPELIEPPKPKQES